MESRFRDLVVDALFPRFCFGCRKEGVLWCDTCASTWWPSPVKASCPFCDRGSSFFVCSNCRSDVYLDGLSVFAHYGNPIVKDAIRQWKFVGDSTAQNILFSWLVRAAPALRPPFENPVFVPVPLHRFRRRERGFDQAGVLADWCGQIYSSPVFDLLIRTRNTKSQSQKSRDFRKLGELDGLFVINPLAICHSETNLSTEALAKVEGRRIYSLPEEVVLCDDVFTSGATMDAAARCLKENGVKKVWGFVIAKGNIN